MRVVAIDNKLWLQIDEADTIGRSQVDAGWGSDDTCHRDCYYLADWKYDIGKLSISSLRLPH